MVITMSRLVFIRRSATTPSSHGAAPTGRAPNRPGVTRIGLGAPRQADTVEHMADQSSSAGPTSVASAGQGTDGDYRIEHDTMGEVRVPAAAKYQAQTQRAVENFPISFRGLERSQIRALALIKGAAARVNARLGVVDQDMADAIAGAAERVAAGEFDGEFPIDVFQTGSGTSSNMNTNEVLATWPAEALGRKVHPNDHVNASQSSNDVFPTSIHVAATEAVTPT